MKLTPSNTDLLLLDFDGTFYEFTEEFIQHCNEAGGRTALRLGAPLELVEATELAVASHLEFGSSLTVFQRRYGFSVEKSHEVYHEEIENHFIKEAQVTVEHLRACPVPQVLLSHSNRTWIKAMLHKFGLDVLFPDDKIFALEDVGFHLKLVSPEPYRRVLEKVGARAEHTVMVEDTVRNLIPAKEIGMTTIYITQGRAFDAAKHPEVDYAFVDLPAFLDAFKD